MRKWLLRSTDRSCRKSVHVQVVPFLAAFLSLTLALSLAFSRAAGVGVLVVCRFTAVGVRRVRVVKVAHADRQGEAAVELQVVVPL